MARLLLPMTVRTPAGALDVMVLAPGPLPWSEVRPAVLHAVGLPPGSVLHHGIGPIEPDWLLGSPPLLVGSVVGTSPSDDLPESPPVVLAAVAGPDAGRCVPLRGDPVLVGRDPDADLALRDPQVSFRHALLRPTGTAVHIIDLGSTNGALVDGSPAGDSAAATNGSLIRMGGTLLRVQSTVEPAAALVPDGAGHLVLAPGRTLPLPAAPVVPPPPGPPPERPRRPLPLLAALVGAGVGGSLALVLGSPTYLAFAALGPVTMLGSALSDRASGRRSHRRALREHQTAVTDHDAAVSAAVTAARLAAWDRWPDPATLLRRAERAGARLWERRPGDGDFLRLAVGTGSRPAPLDVPEPPAVTEFPLTVDLPGVGVLGLAGDHRPLLRWLLTQLVCLHSPADLAVRMVGWSPDLAAFRDVPHGSDPAVPPPVGQPGKDLVVVLDGIAAFRSDAATALLARAASELGRLPPAEPMRAQQPGVPARHATAPRVVVLCAARSAADLPPQCTATLLVSGGRARLLSRPDAAVAAAVADLAAGPLESTGMPAELFERVLRALTPLQDGSARSPADLPATLALSDLLGPFSASRLLDRWHRHTARAVIGRAADGPVALDLDADGPHLLIAGTTGSGKSELLQTLIAAWAIAAPPQAITFLLVDYKGGSAFSGVARLPHTVGIVTDLDPGLAARALASLRAELRRRERLAAAHGPAPPRLVIVIDEFAALAAELPDFLAGLVDVAQRGRALGLHLVLATQRPAGVISPAIRANTAARVCLRVTDSADSVDVIDAPDAARIGAGTPGRGLLRTAGGLREFQSALVTGPAVTGVRVWRRHAPSGPGGRDGRDGPGEPAATQAPCARPQHPTAPSELEVLVAAARTAAGGRPVPDPPWLPALPARYEPGPARPDCLALADLPEEQARRELTLPHSSVLVVGPPGSGRSTALRRIAAIAAYRGAELVVVDGAGALADLRGWSAVSSWLDLEHPRLVRRLVDLLTDRARAPRDRRTRWLVADEYALLTAALERADYGAGAAALAELPSRGAGCGVRVAAAGPPGLLHQRAAAGFGTVIQLGDMPGRPIPGRARWSDREVQIADAPPGTLPGGDGVTARTHPPGEVRSSGDGAAPAERQPATLERVVLSGDEMPAPGHHHWPDRLVVRPLPTFIPADALPTPTPAAVPLGLGGDSAEPVTLDLAGRGGAVLVAGPRCSGVSSALQLVVLGAARAGIPVIRVHVGGPAAATPPPAGRDRRPEVLVTDIDVSADPQPLRAALSAHPGALLLVVDQRGAGAGHPAAEVCERFCQVARPGQHLLLGERLDVLARAPRGHLGAALGFRRALLLAPDVTDGFLLDVALPRRTGPTEPGRGFWVDGGTAIPVQVAYP